jgi:hypothetical protein
VDRFREEDINKFSVSVQLNGVAFGANRGFPSANFYTKVYKINTELA